MSSVLLPVHPGLRTASRWTSILPPVGGSVLWRDVAVCVVSGAAAAICVHAIDWNLKIPGHAILRSVIPVLLGLSIAPRRGAGLLIGASAFVATYTIRATGLGSVGVGAMTSLLAIGPLLDVALWHSQGGRLLLLRCAGAGMLANLAAFAIRGGQKFAGWDALTMRPLSDWWSFAILSYLVCGLVAGLAGGILGFRWTTVRP